MSEIGFKIEVLPQPLSDEEREALRQHYLVYAKAERDEHRSLHKDLQPDRCAFGKWGHPAPSLDDEPIRSHRGLCDGRLNARPA